MPDGPPISQQAPPAVERGPSPSYPLNNEFMSLASDMAAKMLGGLIAVTPGEMTPQSAASIAVEMAMAVANEVRLYRLVDGKAVKITTEQGKDA